MALVVRVVMVVWGTSERPVQRYPSRWCAYQGRPWSVGEGRVVGGEPVRSDVGPPLVGVAG